MLVLVAGLIGVMKFVKLQFWWCMYFLDILYRKNSIYVRSKYIKR